MKAVGKLVRGPRSTGLGQRRARGLAPLIGAALAVAVLGGCAGSPTDVATVGNTSISRDQLDSSLAGARAVGQQFSNDQLLSVLIQGEIADQVADQRGITITDSDRDKQLNPAVLKVQQARDLAYDLADIQIVNEALGEDEFKKVVTAADVEINPRYGSWKPSQALAVIPGTGSLSRAGGQGS